MITTLEPTVKTLPIIEELCQRERLPLSKFSVLADGLQHVLAEANKHIALDTRLKVFQSVILNVENTRLFAEFWTNGGFKRLPLTCGVSSYRDCRVAVEFKVFKEMIDTAEPSKTSYVPKSGKNRGKVMWKKTNRYPRLDLEYDPNTNVLKVDGGNWRSRFLTVPSSELPAPATKTIEVYSKEQLDEMKWLARSSAKNDSRPVLQFANVIERNSRKCAITGDGYHIHASINHMEDLQMGLIDINGLGLSDDDRVFPDLTDTLSSTTADQVCVYFTDFERAVKTALAATDKKDKNNPIEMSFNQKTLAVTGSSVKHGTNMVNVGSSGIAHPRKVRMNAKFILDALKDSKGIPTVNGTMPNQIIIRFVPDSYDVVQFIVGKGRSAWIMPITEAKQ